MKEDPWGMISLCSAFGGAGWEGAGREAAWSEQGRRAGRSVVLELCSAVPAGGSGLSRFFEKGQPHDPCPGPVSARGK